jgi:4'-phosphopantetheinyl transferase EntD
MALVHYEALNSDSAWGIWKIEESEEQLLEVLKDSASDLLHFQGISHPRIRLESIASRVVVKELTSKFGAEYQGLFKNKNGKPFLYNLQFNISYSHTENYAAAIIHKSLPVGIDSENIQPKLLNIATRFLSEPELKMTGDDLRKICACWCAKEAMYKLYNIKDVEFRDNLKLSHLVEKADGSFQLQAEIHVGSFHSKTNIYCKQFEDIMVAYCY